MLDLADEEVEFKGRFGFDLVRIRHDDVGQGLAEVLHKCVLLLFVSLLVKFEKFAFNGPDLCIRVDDGKSRLGGKFTLQDRRQHIQPTFRKRFRSAANTHLDCILLGRR